MKDIYSLIGKIFLYLFMWGVFVAVVTHIDSNTLSNIPVWANAMIILVVFLAPYWLSKLIWEKGRDATHMIAAHVNNAVVTQETVTATNAELSVYDKTREGLKSIPNDVLLKNYNKFKGHIDDHTRLLALEDELVNRHLIAFSPTRRKIDELMTKFKL
jgi:hypothetical protein